MTGSCIDCGRPASGTRCRVCHGRFEAEKAAINLRAADTELLQMRDVEKLPTRRIATRLNLSHSRVWQRLRDARRREKMREDMAAKYLGAGASPADL